MTYVRKNRALSLRHIRSVLLIAAFTLLLSGCGNWLYGNIANLSNQYDFLSLPAEKQRELIQLHSEISLYKFDGTNTTVYFTKEYEKVKDILERLGNVHTGLKLKKEPLKAEAPIYGIQVRTRGSEFVKGARYVSDFAWYDGNLYTWEKKHFGFRFDFDGLIESLTWDKVEKYPGASFLPCANYLFKGDDSWRYEYLTEAANESLSTKYSPHFPFISKNPSVEKESGPEINISVRLTLKDTKDGSDEALNIDEQADVKQLEVFHEEKWYSVPMHSKVKWQYADWTFPLHGKKTVEASVNLTDIYGDLPQGRYRWKVRDESGVTYVAFDIDETGHGVNVSLIP